MHITQAFEFVQHLARVNTVVRVTWLCLPIGSITFQAKLQVSCLSRLH